MDLKTDQTFFTVFTLSSLFQVPFKSFARWWINLFRLLSLPRGAQERFVFRRNDAFSGNIPDIDVFLTQIFHLFFSYLFHMNIFIFDVLR